jgi:hypothetical protein
MSTNQVQASQNIDTVATPTKSQAKDVNLGESFENKDASNPLASRKKTLAEKVQENAEKVLAEKEKGQKKPVQKKQSAVIEGESQNDVGGFAKPTPKPEPKVAKPKVDPKIDESVQDDQFTDLSGTADQDVIDEPAPWEANYKFKYKKFDANSRDGVDVESEIPEEFRALIKDPDTEKSLREMFEKSHGLDYVKETRTKIKQERDQITGHLQEVYGKIRHLEENLTSGNLDAAFDQLQIPEQKVLQWVLDKINYSQLDPAQQQMISAQRDAEKKAQMLESQNQTLAQNHHKALVQAKSVALQATLDRSDLKAVADAYDNRQGRKPTDPSFKDLVINHGELTWHRSGGKIDLSPQEAAEAVLRDYGIGATYGSQNNPETPNRAQNTNAQVRQQNSPAKPQSAQSLPNISGRAASPTKPRITTRQQLMAYRKQVLGS